jgi:hypothetical protein
MFSNIGLDLICKITWQFVLIFFQLQVTDNFAPDCNARLTQACTMRACKDLRVSLRWADFNYPGNRHRFRQ